MSEQQLVLTEKLHSHYTDVGRRLRVVPRSAVPQASDAGFPPARKRLTEKERWHKLWLIAECQQLNNVQYRPLYGKIEARICKALGVSRNEIRSSRRHRDVVFARHAVMYWTIRLTSLSLPAVGRIMRRDHTTILHGKNAHVARRAKQGRNLRQAR